MRDPHIQKLHYKIGSGEGISYEDPENLSFSNDFGGFCLHDGRLTITPKEHFADEVEARQAVKPFLRAWEIEADLKQNIGMIRFTFEKSEIVDRDPPPPGTPQSIELKGTASFSFSGRAEAHLTCRRYPQPPVTFRATSDVEDLYRRWKNYRDGKEPLPTMAYLILTKIEKTAGSREKAKETFKISSSILDKIANLSTNRGDVDSARKAHKNQPYQEFSGAEKRWLESAVPLVIHRMGEYASGLPLIKLTLDDLPKS